MRIGGTTVDFSNAKRTIAAEWDARKPDRESPAGYAPTIAFNQYVQQLRSLRSDLNCSLQERVVQNQALDKTDIDNLKSLEYLVFLAETKPGGRRRSAGMDDFYGGMASSKVYENYMRNFEKSRPATDRYKNITFHTS